MLLTVEGLQGQMALVLSVHSAVLIHATAKRINTSLGSDATLCCPEPPHLVNEEERKREREKERERERARARVGERYN